jgi:hypothetical protein
MDQLTAQVDGLRQAMGLRGLDLENANELRALHGIHASLLDLEALVAQLGKRVDDDRAGLAAGRALVERLQQRETAIAHLEQHFPARVDKMVAGGDADSNKENAAMPVGLPTSSSTAATTAAAAAAAAAAAGNKKKGAAGAGAAGVPLMAQLAYVKVSEFEAVPKYMRGRLTREHINDGVDIINLAFKAKYSLLALPRGKLSRAQMDLHIQYKELECDETAGKCFVVDADLKPHGGARIDKAVMTILRHVGRLTEHRSKGCLRHVALPAV